MSIFDKYFLMQEEDIVDYVKEKNSFFNKKSLLEVKEIGDGNLNYVYRVVDTQTKQSLIIKQAGTVARISEDIHLSTNRIKIEYEVLSLYRKFAPDFAPALHGYDAVMNCFAMEDLSEFRILRDGLIHYQTYPLLAEHMSTFVVNTLLPTTDVFMEHKEKKQRVKEFSNPELCEISEELVYTEPFTDHNSRNILFGPNEEWLRKEIYSDQTLRVEAAKLKFSFMNNAQALIHGDLHTGSIFVTERETKVIDPEFAFYGPIGYDVGNLIANLVFAHIRAVIAKEDKYVKWSARTIESFVDLFQEKFIAKWNEGATDLLAKEVDFQEHYLKSVMEDTAGVCGMEIIRRVVGLAKVKDIVSIESTEHRSWAEKVCVLFAKDCIMKRESLRTGSQYMKLLQEKIENYEVI